MAKYKSEKKIINSNVSDVYHLLSDLTNWGPLLETTLKERKKEEKAEDSIKDLKINQEELSFTIQGINIAIKIVELEENKTIKIESVNSPFSFKLWIQLKEESSYETKMLLTLDVHLNLVMKGMLAKPIKKGINKVADTLATIDYPQLIKLTEEYKKKKELDS